MIHGWDPEGESITSDFSGLVGVSDDVAEYLPA